MLHREKALSKAGPEFRKVICPVLYLQLDSGERIATRRAKNQSLIILAPLVVEIFSANHPLSHTIDLC